MISVIIPLYNKEASIEQTLRSVFSQDYDDFEVVIVDDGSTDDSAQIVRSYIKQGLNDNNEQSSYDNLQVSTNGSNENKRCLYDNDNTASQTITTRNTHLSSLIPHPSSLITYPSSRSILLIEQENGGPSKARNTGVKHAQGEWIVFLDADDELMPGALRLMMGEVEKYPDADIIDFGGYIRQDQALSLRKHPLTGKVANPLRAFYYRQISPGCGHSIFRASFVKAHPYDERLRRYEDCDILLRMLPVAKVYSSQVVTEIHDVNYAEASHARKDIMEDYMGYLDMNSGGFWYKMCVFRTFIEERDYYPEACRRLYPSWYWRYDLLLMMKIL